MGTLCQKLRVLPRAGGLLDQDPVIVMALGAMIAAQAERQELDQAKSEAGRKLTTNLPRRR